MRGVGTLCGGGDSLGTCNCLEGTSGASNPSGVSEGSTMGEVTCQGQEGEVPRPTCAGGSGLEASWPSGRGSRVLRPGESGSWGSLAGVTGGSGPRLGLGWRRTGCEGTHCLNIFSMSLICFLENSLNSV